MIPNEPTALQLINALAKLPSNWDGCGSPALRPTAVDEARRLLSLPGIDQLPSPLIYPTSEGGVQLKWHTPTRGLKINIFPDGSVEFLLIQEHERRGGRLKFGEGHAFVATMMQCLVG